MDTRRFLAPFFVLTLCAGACRLSGDPPASASSTEAAALVLDRLHRLAALADGEAYFELFEPDAIYLGTDAGERWSVDQFRAFAEPYFSRGQGWDYRVTERHLYTSADGRTVWFDERLQNASYGECRGSGVLVQGGSGWKIAQYVLSLPVPNELAGDLVERIRALDSGSQAGPGSGGL